MNEVVVVVKDGDLVYLTVPHAEGKTCVYVTNENGKIVLTGGASIIKRIEGEGMKEKVVKLPRRPKRGRTK